MAKGRHGNHASAGHQLGQLVGVWFEEYFVLPMLLEVAKRLQLYLDHRFQSRPARGAKLVWRDEDSNSVDFDFVMEFDASDTNIGIPVAFIESCWRRGTRHSKDKARDDTGKLLPMREAYPTARFLGIVVGGDFTEPARELVRSRQVDLLYVPKEKVVAAFASENLQMDYPDRAAEPVKRRLAAEFIKAFTLAKKKAVVKNLRKLLGAVAVSGYVSAVHRAMAALPQEIRISEVRASAAQIFESIAEVTKFLESPSFNFDRFGQDYRYEITYSDGSEFSRDVASVAEVKSLHSQIERLANHLAALETQE